ncbi:FBP domain-containing protein [Zhihengliuella sp.]|uniref:FBP domain-containing protein n=1 Tax=Zhihengliuella sp. TaxID=1954483 RepID=UPI002810D9D9|nr:FBP domain-containing protein [Zhihengliuella sp.]
MNPLSDHEIRTSFVNCSRKDAARLSLPPGLRQLDWSRREYLGWRDRQDPRRGFAVVPTPDGPVGFVLQTGAVPGGSPRAAMCAWCEDVYLADPAVLYVARRAGQAGRDGSTVGTLICENFQCSANVRKRPPLPYKGFDLDAFVAERVEGLRHRVAGFAASVLR